MLGRVRPRAADAGGRGARRDPRRAGEERRVLVRPPRRHRARARNGAARALGSRLGGRGDERRLAAAARRAPLRRSRSPSGGRGASRARARPASPRRRAAGRSPTASSPATRTGAPSPSSCSSGRASSPATASAARGSPGGYGAVYGELQGARDARPLPARVLRRGPRRRAVRARRRGRAAPRAAAARRRRGRSRWCWRPPTRRSRTAQCCRGRSGRARAPRGSPARTSSCSAASRRCSSSAAAARSSRCATRTTEWLRPALAALVEHARRFARKRLAVERFDGEPVGRERRFCRCSSRPGSSPARAAPCFVPSGTGARAASRRRRAARSPARTRCGCR